MYADLIRKGLVCYDAETDTYVRNIRGNEFHLNPEDEGISRALARDGVREKESVEALFEYVKPDMVIFDLGANIGFYVLLEAIIVSKGTGRIIALEPHPDNVALLTLNVSKNNYSNIVQIHFGAIAEESGTAILAVSSFSNCHQLATLREQSAHNDLIDVPAFSLADFLKKAGTSMEELDFLRMDVEGAEYPILLNNIHFFREKRELLLFVEFHPHVDLPKHIELLQALDETGFECLSVTKESIQDGRVDRKTYPDASTKDLYTDDALLAFGGCEAFLRKA